MSYIKASPQESTREQEFFYRLPKNVSRTEATRIVNEIVEQANEHIARKIRQALEAEEVVRQGAQAEVQKVYAEAQAEIDRIRAEANSLVAFWQQQAEDLGHELARADREIHQLKGELAQKEEQSSLPKVSRRRQERKKGRQWEED